MNAIGDGRRMAETHSGSGRSPTSAGAASAAIAKPLSGISNKEGKPELARPITRWGLLWQSRNCLDGERSHIVMRDCMPALFHTRAAARKYRAERYGYIKTRPDLRREPFGWIYPKVVRVIVDLRRAR